MRWNVRALMLMLSTTVLLGGCAARDGEAVEVYFETPAGRSPVVLAHVADTVYLREKGLMHVREMPAQEGMLFVWPKAEMGKFWMRNTLISLDMIFVNKGRVIFVEHRAQPLTDTPRGPDEPFDSVLEVNGGWAVLHGVDASATMLVRGV